MRAQRFPLEVPLQYRPVGDTTWRVGTTANISRSGVLFQGDNVVGIDTELEMRIRLSQAQFPPTAADLVCHAKVVRTQRSSANQIPMLAASFSKYRLDPVQD